MIRALLFLLLFNSSLAASVMGGYIQASCVDDPTTTGLEYYVELTIVRDHGSNTDLYYDIEINGVSHTLSLTYSDLIINPVDYFEYIDYGDTIVLNANTSYWFSWSECCRSTKVQNVASTDSLFIEAYLATGNGCNEIPRLLAQIQPNWNDGYGQTALTAFSKGATRVSYAFRDPMESDSTFAPYTPIQGSMANPLSIDTNGILSFGRNGLSGVYAVVLNIEARDSNDAVYAFTQVETVFGLASSDTVDVKPIWNIVNRSHQWVVNELDSVRWRIKSSQPTNTRHFLPEVFQQKAFKQGLNQSGDSSEVSFLWNPVPAEAKVNYPMVIRTSAGTATYDEVVWVKTDFGVGLMESNFMKPKFYPNPAMDEVMIEIQPDEKEICFIDLRGSIISKHRVGGVGVERVKCPDTPGVYLLVIVDIQGRNRVGRIRVE